MKNIQNIILSRTDSIGDMVLALPMAKALKERFPGIKVAVLGRPYTKPIVAACRYVDVFIELDDFMNDTIAINGEPLQAIVHVKPESYVAKRAKELRIPLRIGTTNRLYHWYTCNRLMPLSRKRSHLHEAQLNLKLLRPLGVKKWFSYEDISGMYGLQNLEPLMPEYTALLNRSKYNLLLHPKSRGNAREWGIDNYISLIQLLDLSKYELFISGTESERQYIQPLFDAVGDKVTDMVGKLPLSQFISFINQCNGLIACSTGPLHVGASLGKDAYGLYVPMHPLHAGRWQPIGKHAIVFVVNKPDCNDCRNNSKACHCIKEISAIEIQVALEANRKRLLNGVEHL